MKSLHWIIFAIAFWILLAPFILDDLFILFLNSTGPDGMLVGTLGDQDLVTLTRWDDLLLGLAIVILALIVVTLEQANHKTPGLKAMHWMQVFLGVWVAAAPFALSFDYQAFTWSHVVTGGFIALFALLQIFYEHKR